MLKEQKSTPHRSENSALQLVNALYQMANAVVEKPPPHADLLTTVAKTLVRTLEDTKAIILDKMGSQLHHAHELANVVEASETEFPHYLLLMLALRDSAYELAYTPPPP